MTSRPGSTTTATLLKLSLPPIIGMIGGRLMNVVDTAFGGHLGTDALAGMALADAMYAMMSVVGSALLMGAMNFVAARAFGAGDLAGSHRAVINGAFIAAVLAPTLAALFWLSLGLLRPLGADPLMVSSAREYGAASVWGLFPHFYFILLTFYLQSMGDFKFALPIMIVGNVLNVFGDWVLMYGRLGIPPLGVAGCGWSTFLARTVSLVFVVAYLLRRDRKLAVRLVDERFAPSLPEVRALLGAGGPFAIQQLLQFAAIAVGAIIVANLDIASTAANRVVSQLSGLAIMLPLGMSSGCAALVSQRLGAKEPGEAVRLGWRAMFVAVGIAAVLWGALFVFGGGVLRAFSPDEAVISASRKLILVAFVAQLPSAAEVVLSGALRGTGKGGAFLVANAILSWATLPLGWLFAVKLGWGVQGFWLGYGLGKIVSAAILVFAWWRRSVDLMRPSSGLSETVA